MSYEEFKSKLKVVKTKMKYGNETDGFYWKWKSSVYYEPHMTGNHLDGFVCEKSGFEPIDDVLKTKESSIKRYFFNKIVEQNFPIYSTKYRKRWY